MAENSPKRIPNKLIPILALIIFAVGGILGSKIFNPNRQHQPNVDKTQTTNRVPSNTPKSDASVQNVIDPNAELIYTKHAQCRMECRDISKDEIRETLREGHINWQKSEENHGQCPTYAIEDRSNVDGQNLRIVFAKCDQTVKVVTAIDLGVEHDCDCK